MKKIRYFLVVLVALSTLSSCNNSGSKANCNIDTSNFKLEEVNGLYSIEVPENMTVTKALNTDASMQLEDIFEEMYAAIIDEPKSPFIENFKAEGLFADSLTTLGNYRNVQLGLFLKGMVLRRQSEPKTFDINGLSAEQVEIVGFPSGLDFDVYYLITFIEGKDNLYMFLEWTLAPREEDHKDTFSCIAKTFEEM
jgi:hypothetical protein